MKIFNPTPERFLTKHAGIMYVLDPGFSIDVVEDTGKWILERWSEFGIVSLDFKGTEGLQNNIIKKTLEGLDKYISHCHHVLAQFIELDTELKAINNHGTVLKHNRVKYWTTQLEIAVKMVKDLEAKYGLSIKQEESEIKTRNLFAAIDTLVSDFEQDAEAQHKAKEEETEYNKMLKDMIPSQVLNRFSGDAVA